MITNPLSTNGKDRRRGRIGPAAVVLLVFLFAACTDHDVRQNTAAAPEVSIAEIEEGIEAHIENEVTVGDGFFHLPFKDRKLSLKLVRVHTEYLSNLGPGRHFACVDLVDVSGDVYDVDFFLTGEPGAMTVTETTVHKINGQPYYLWDQKRDGTWRRISVDRASEGHFGIVRESDSFEFYYRAVLPEFSAPARMWLPLPESDRFQTVDVLSVNVPGEQKILHETAHGNRILFLELAPEDSGKTLEMRFAVTRSEKAAYATPAPDPMYLDPGQASDDRFRKIAQKVTAGKKQDLVKARALYDHVIDSFRYQKYGEGWGQGDAVYACDARTGNCSDFHAYFIALARSIGIPARFAIGAGIPSERDDGGIDGYHCWVEFYADGKWWPIDISEGDKYSALSTYYFGHHPANRFELSRGRDLKPDPLPASGPINFLAYPVLEIGGKPDRAAVTFSFRRTAPH
jgi:transglutaminase-like putative cysteine protease